RLGRYFRFHNEELLGRRHRLVSTALNSLKYRDSEINQFWEKIIFNFEGLIKKIYEDLKHKKEKIKLLNPRNILRRGYSVTFKNNKAIKKAKDLNPGDHIKTVLFEGSVFSEIKKKKYNLYENT
ncbi:MAG: hypothetical protein GF375_04105, partial [Candidatus Omnitrophica bacterium]|nr:hypothetical protein [Candidatus Omnitrophota bacterium]MBD3269232.1 hypothetical protein [Candidatus Omnitrophota bacterium]